MAKELAEMKIDVYAVSLDDVATLKKFAEKESFTYRLLSDADASSAKKYGALGRSGRWASRVTFIIDDAGVLRHVFEKVSVRSHGDDVIEKCRALRS